MENPRRLYYLVKKQSCKPGSVPINRSLSFLLEHRRRCPPATYPQQRPKPETGRLICCLFGLSTPEVYQHPGRPEVSWALTPRFHPCPKNRSLQGGLFSVALSVNGWLPFRPLPVRKQDALCCPDFPHSTEAERDKADCFGQRYRFRPLIDLHPP